jgi:hypothetical protein
LSARCLLRGRWPLRKKSGVFRKEPWDSGFRVSGVRKRAGRHSFAWCLVRRGTEKLAHNGLAGRGQTRRVSHSFDAAPGGPCATHQHRLEVAGGPAGAIRTRRLRPHRVRPTFGLAPVMRHERADTDSVSPYPLSVASCRWRGFRGCVHGINLHRPTSGACHFNASIVRVALCTPELG